MPVGLFREITYPLQAKDAPLGKYQVCFKIDQH